MFRGAPMRRRRPCASREFVESWVRQELLYQEALSRQLDENARILDLIEQTRRDLLVAALLEREFGGP